MTRPYDPTENVMHAVHVYRGTHAPLGQCHNCDDEVAAEALRTARDRLDALGYELTMRIEKKSNVLTLINGGI